MRNFGKNLQFVFVQFPLFLSVLFFGVSGKAADSGDLTASQIFEKCKGSIFVVQTLNAKNQMIAMGSGVKLPSGRIVTNFHVVKGGTNYRVGQASRFVPAQIVAADAEKDICLLNASVPNSSSASVGSSSNIKVGARVYAIGSPKGLELSLSDGIVSQLRGKNPPIIQTTAAISPGSSGGGLFDAKGNLIGITTFCVTDGQSLNFALPVEYTARVKNNTVTSIQSISSTDRLAKAATLELEEQWEDLYIWAKEWAEEDKSSDLARIAIGESALRLNKPNEAIMAYRSVLEINPDSDLAWSAIGRIYMQTGRTADAIDALNQALAISPNDNIIYEGLGRCYLSSKNTLKAIESFDKSTQIAPTNVNSWYYLGLSYDSLDRRREARAAYQQSLKVDPKHSNASNAWMHIGMNYLEDNEDQKGIDALEKAIEINPKNVPAWSVLATTYYRTGNKLGASRSASALQKIDPIKAAPYVGMIIR